MIFLRPFSPPPRLPACSSCGVPASDESIRKRIRLERRAPAAPCSNTLRAALDDASVGIGAIISSMALTLLVLPTLYGWVAS